MGSALFLEVDGAGHGFRFPWRCLCPLDLHGQFEFFRAPISWEPLQDTRQGDFVRGVHQGVSHAAAVCASCASNAVHIVVGHAGDVEVDHDFRFGNVNAPCTHICADQDPNIPSAELSHGRQTRVLCFVGVDLCHLLGHGVLQRLSHTFGILLGPHEQQGT